MNASSSNQSFFSTVESVSTFLLANFLWVVLSITVIGMPFATVGLFAISNHWVQGRQPEIFRVFGGAIRDHWAKAVVITALNAVACGLLFVNFSIFRMMRMDNFIAILSGTMTLSAAVLVCIMNIYVWSYLALLDLPIRKLIKLSLGFTLTYPLISLGLAVLFVLPIIMSLFLPVAIFLFVTFSTCAYLAGRVTWYVLKRHFTAKELDELTYLPITYDLNR